MGTTQEQAMFDFITDEQLRASLESDYAELLAASGAGAWKAVHVLAGSIIETILVDYLMSISYKPAKGRDVLEMSLGALISASRSENILTDEVEKLSSVLQDYRNLIHPGRGLRLNRKVTQSTARVAQSLVEIIAHEIGEKKRETYGYTAEMVVDKIERDHSAIGILNRLIAEMKQPIEMERLLTRVLPERYFSYLDLLDEEPVGPTVRALRQCFRPVFDAAPDDVKRRTTRNFVRIIREEGQTNVVEYEDSFFQCADLTYLDSNEAELVKQHILARFTTAGRRDLRTFLRVTTGIGAFLTPPEAMDYAQAACLLLSNQAAEELDNVRSTVAFALADEYEAMSSDAQASFARRYDQWVQAFGHRNQPEIVEALEVIRQWWTPSN